MFCPNCRKKHSLRECELNSISLCNICELEHSTGQCPELPRLKAVLRESSEEVQSSYFITPRRPWQQRPPSMCQYFSSFNSWNNAYNTQQYPWQYPTPPLAQFPSPWNQWSPSPSIQYPQSQPYPWNKNSTLPGLPMQQQSQLPPFQTPAPPPPV